MMPLAIVQMLMIVIGIVKIGLSSILSINDNNNTNVALNTCHCSYFYNEKVNPDIKNKKIHLMLLHHALQQNNLKTLCMIQRVCLLFT